MLGLLTVYGVILVLTVFVFVTLARRLRPGHRRTQMIMSFVSGLMLGIAVFHLLPHALYAARSIDAAFDDNTSIDFVALWLMIGLLSMFLLQRLFHFHQHDFDESYSDTCSDGHMHNLSGSNTPSSYEAAQKNIGGVALGLGLHSVMDGVALAASVIAGYAAHVSSQPEVVLAGLGVFLAILLHKPLDAVTIDVFMKQSGARSSSRTLLVLLFSMICPVIALLVVAGLDMESFLHSRGLVAALAFSAGIFLCIALSDLLPEIHFHSHDRLSMTVALLAGIALSFVIKFVEADSSHHFELGEATSAYQHNQRGSGPVLPGGESGA